ncbi:multicopper oxidase [Paenibacillus sp. J5C_2022]|uniref:multicopper oxidase family protein n=1 Tax=Paenibacillus sp. J5C2022 TaxID=2977129 RepID=UPI0021CECEE6|nr:multicopper oxidase [Paenibacillus sp. J5C2022]MCU6708869.1 multicopper oxidase [Paenibacillus sp. J5C2022]
MELPRFIDKLPVPPVLKPVSSKGGVRYYEATMSQFYQSLHSSMPDTKVWGYEGIYPGPVIEVSKGERIRVKWRNELPDKHFLPIDKTVHGAVGDTPEVRTVVHLHGGVTKADSDGYPDAWFTNGFKEVGPAFTQQVYEYDNPHEACTLWYHDHAIGITRLNIYAGLAGYYMIHDRNERSLNLPKERYDIPLMIQDRCFQQDGSLYYPSAPADPIDNPEHMNPSIISKFMGDTILVNGKVWPYLEVEPRKYRLRFINGSNARYYKLRLGSYERMNQIATDAGLLNHPVPMRTIVLAPAERAEIIIDFSVYRNQKIVLYNDAKDNYHEFPDDPEVNKKQSRYVMQFRVHSPLRGVDTSTIPNRLNHIAFYKAEQAARNRMLALIVRDDRYGRKMRLLDYKLWNDPVSEKPALGDIEIWDLFNPTSGGHPIHIHLVKFQILDYQDFDVKHYEETKEVRLIGHRYPPPPNERGWKDIVNVYHGKYARVIAKFAPYSGRFVWHCHILEHEDYEMMRPFDVVEKTLFRRLLKLWKGNR